MIEKEYPSEAAAVPASSPAPNQDAPARPPCRSPGEVAQKLKQLLFRHRKHLIEQSLQRQPETCRHNYPTYLPDGEDVYVGDGPPLPRFCDHPDRRGMVCDPEYGGEGVARDCPLWQPLKTVDEIKRDFRNLVASGPVHMAKLYPDATALMWVLGEGAEDVLDGEVDAEPPDEADAKPLLSFFRILGRRS